MSGFQRFALYALPFATLLAALLFQAFDPLGVLQAARGTLFDLFQQESPRAYVDPATRGAPAVRVVDIDQESVNRFGPWPWPREALAILVERARDAGANTVAFDFPLPGPDRSSPEFTAALLPEGPDFEAARNALATMPRYDDALIEAMEGITTVVGFAAAPAGLAPRLRTTLATAGGGNPLDYVPSFRGALTTLPRIEAVSAGNGALDIPAEPDGRVRRLPLLFQSNGILYPSLALEAVRVGGGAAAATVMTRDAGAEALIGAPSGVVSIGTAARAIETAGDGSLFFYDTGPIAARHLSAVSLIEGTADMAKLRGAILIVGGTNPILQTPLGLRQSRAEVAAQAVEQMLLGATPAPPEYGKGIELAIAAALGLVLAVLALLLGGWWTLPLLLIALGGAFGGSWYVFGARQWLLDPAGASLALFAAWFAGSYSFASRRAHRRAALRDAFLHTLPEDVVARILRRPKLLRLEGETRTLTVMVGGIGGLANLADHWRDDPETMTRLVGRVLTPLTRAVLDQRGTIDKYAGDSLVAFWNAPLDNPEHATDACECALRLLEAQQKVNKTLEEESLEAKRAFEPISLAIGIATGDCVVGDIGPEHRFDYSALGRAVNQAARLQAYTANYGIAACCTGATRELAQKTFALLKVDELVIKGQDDPVEIYAVMGTTLMAASPVFRALEAFHKHIFDSFHAREWEKVRALSEECRKVKGASQKLYDLYGARATYLQENPPPEDWDGVWRALDG